MNITAYKLYDNADKILPIESADYKRDWMDSYAHAFAYRCLPLKIANESGWLVRCPTNFTAEYVTDDSAIDSVKIKFDSENNIYTNYIRSHFGRGVVTLSLPYIFRTPEPWCVWARGYPNYYKHNVSFLEGIIETYWLHSTFTYNIRIIEKNKPVEFKTGEPLMFLTCVNINEINKSIIDIDNISNNTELQRAYKEWSESRSNFNKKQRNPEEWQKDYFKGLNTSNNIETNHLTTVKTYIGNKNG